MSIADSQRLDFYRTMVRVRRFDRLASEALQRGAIKLFWHGAEGHEASGVGAVSALAPDDYLYYHYRGHGLPYLLAKGVDPKYIFAEHYGKATGTCHSLSGFHTVAPELGVYGWAGFLGVQFGITVGYGKAAKLEGRGRVAMCLFGDGSANKGQFHESLNMSALWTLPVVWVCENNRWASSTSLEEHLSAPSGTYIEQASSYGMPSTHVDGGDVEAVYQAASDAVARAREGSGPSYIETSVFRPFAHAQGLSMPLAHHDRVYDPEDWATQDPIVRYERDLVGHGLLTPELIAAIVAEADSEAERIEQFCAESLEPDGHSIDLMSIGYTPT